MYGPFDLVLLASGDPFLWSTTDRTRIDRFSVRDQNGTRNKMCGSPRIVAGSAALQRVGRSAAMTYAEPMSLARFPNSNGSSSGVTKTETVGVPVHAVLTANPDRTIEAVLELLGDAGREGVLVTFVNPAAVPLARRSASFRQSLRDFDLVFPDGVGMCLAIKWLHGLTARRVSFDTTSLAPAVFKQACSGDLSVVLVGGGTQVAETARAQLAENFPGIRITGCFDGFGNLEAKASAVKELAPDIVVCGMGSGRQESFLLELKAQGWRGWGFTCGGYLDQLGAGMTYYPAWVDAANLRWAYRLAREPGRLWRRYLIEYSHFGLLVCAARINKRRHAFA